jgi:hypothetical protein
VEYLTKIGTAVDAPVLLDDDVAALDPQGDFPFVNTAILRRPMQHDALRDAVTRLGAFYGSRPGGPWVLFSPVPTADLSDLLTLGGHPPFMVRGAGSAAPELPPGLTIERVTSPTALSTFESTLIEAYPAAPSGRFFAPGVLDAPGIALWLGTFEGRPVATAIAHTTSAVNDVEAISTRADVRGRGIGAAITWSATLADASKPSVLIASDAGQPIYERMGYLRVLRMTLWIGDRRHGA